MQVLNEYANKIVFKRNNNQNGGVSFYHRAQIGGNG